MLGYRRSALTLRDGERVVIQDGHEVTLHQHQVAIEVHDKVAAGIDGPFVARRDVVIDEALTLLARRAACVPVWCMKSDQSSMQ